MGVPGPCGNSEAACIPLIEPLYRLKKQEEAGGPDGSRPPGSIVKQQGRCWIMGTVASLSVPHACPLVNVQEENQGAPRTRMWPERGCQAGERRPGEQDTPLPYAERKTAQARPCAASWRAQPPDAKAPTSPPTSPRLPAQAAQRTPLWLGNSPDSC
uniref:Uncharacterized protein n=1 Tax=Pipistrellus kuhlii TaxID=59472 RepID=A0A7J7V0Q6_PIPKU|nr:hypothetical protein mPipKuh1_008665 [Pipistrellus kuhlii]